VGHSLLSGRVFEALAPLIDGIRSTDDVIAAVQSRVSAAEAYYAITVLEQKGYLIESTATGPTPEAVFWSLQSVSPDFATRNFSEKSVRAESLGDISLEPFISGLASLHVRIQNEGDLTVVVTDDYLRPELRAYNEKAFRNRQPWLLVKPVGHEIWIGPLFQPGQTACWECLAQRLRVNRSSDPSSVPAAAIASSLSTAYAVTATEVAKWISGCATACNGKILSIDVLSWTTRLHSVIWQPDCAMCCDAGVSQDPKDLTLAGRRQLRPEQTLSSYEHHVSPITGVVRSLERHKASGDVVHVYVAEDSRVSAPHNLKHRQFAPRSRSFGKGITDTQAKLSCLCEALERYSGVYRGTEVSRKAKLSELGGLGIHPNDCMQFSERQYAQRLEVNPTRSFVDSVPCPFDEDATIDWTSVWSMTGKVQRYLPTAFCYFDYFPQATQKFYVTCSNGCAAGSTFDEAVLQGLFELVERDSVALWWFNRIQRPSVDLDSFDEAYIPRLRTHLARQQRSLWVLDLTSDLGIPVFVALSRRIDSLQEHIMVGFGAHLDARTALLKAVTELSQTLACILPGDESVENGPAILEQPVLLNWLRTATTANQRHLEGDPRLRRKTSRDYSDRRGENVREDVLFCQNIIEQRGFEMLVLDQTRPDIGLPVVKVIVPGLRHFRPRFAPGRLYDVPIQLGWIAKPVAEAELNPIPLFI
jgi:ribosomal protein S12 methylthiotransferase accessory factor